MSTIETFSAETQIIQRVGETPIILELECTKEALSRLGEMEVLNASTLPEFLSILGKAMAESNRAMGVISKEIIKASGKVDRRKAAVLLYEMPRILMEKGIKGSEDVREAILSMDDEYFSFLKQKEYLQAAFEDLKRNIKVLELTSYNIKQLGEFKVMPRYHSSEFSDKEDLNPYSSNR